MWRSLGAERILVLSYAQIRSMHGQRQPRMISRFIGEVDQSLFAKSDRSARSNRRESPSSRNQSELKAWAKRQQSSQIHRDDSSSSAQSSVTRSRTRSSLSTPNTAGNIPIGARVRHKTYGQGQVLSVEQKSRGEAARVRFEATEKVILTSFLTLIDDPHKGR